MKKRGSLLSIMILAIGFAFTTGCDSTPQESCEQDEICTGKSVTACCTDNECYYTFDGKKYGDDAESLAELAAALGCTNGSLPTYEQDLNSIYERLAILSEMAHLSFIKHQ